MTIRRNPFVKDNSGPNAQNAKPCAHRPEPDTTPCVECKHEKSRARRYRWKIILGLVMPYALQALDATIIAAALPWIASPFGKISEQNWIVSAFNLASAAFIPGWAQLADVFGRYAVLMAAILFMMLGSALCTAAPTSAYAMLLLGRGFQGLSTAGINVAVRAILADRVSLSENAMNWSIFSFVGGFSYGLGPVLGGFLTQVNWRWCFAINLPIGAVSLLITAFVLRKELLGPQPMPELGETAATAQRTKFASRLRTIDAGGQILFVFGFGLLILGLTWGGVTHSWSSPAVIVSLAVGGALVGGFVAWERLFGEGSLLSRKLPRQKPMIPWSILTSRDIAIVFYTEFASGMSMFSVLYFCNIYFIAVKGYDSDRAGVQLLCFTPGIGAGVYLCAFACNKWPRMTFPPIILGTLIELAGLSTLAWALSNEHTPTIFGMMALAGTGMGLKFMSSPLHCIALFRKHKAAVVALMAIAVPLGGTIGLTVMSAVFNNTSGIDSHSDFSKIRSEQDGIREQSIHSAKMGVVWAYVAVISFVAISMVTCLFLGNVKLGRSRAIDNEGADNNVIFKDPFLWTLLNGRAALVGQEASNLRSAHDEVKHVGSLGQNIV